MRDFAHDLSALALNTATLGHNLAGQGAGWPIERVVDACAERGMGGIVFWRREFEGVPPRAVGARVRAAGMQVAGLCRAPFLVGPAAGKPAEVMAEFRRAIDLAAELGAPVLTIVAGGVEPGTKGLVPSLARLADRLAEGAVHAAAAGVKLALEPLHPVYAGDRSCVCSLADALDLCDQVGAPGLGVAMDVYHVWWDRQVAAQALRAGPRLLGYHLCDWLADTRDVLLDRGMMGDGVADLRGLRGAVEAAGYRGFCEVEVFSARHWWQEDPAAVLDCLVERFRTCC